MSAGTATQEQVYGHAAADAVTDLLNGINGCVFAYGQTGSGKTYTVNSTTQDACTELFNTAPPGTNFTMSFFEIYGGKVSDLLNEKKKLAIMEDAKGKI